LGTAQGDRQGWADGWVQAWAQAWAHAWANTPSRGRRDGQGVDATHQSLTFAAPCTKTPPRLREGALP
jgi:hypothetical protein